MDDLGAQKNNPGADQHRTASAETAFMVTLIVGAVGLALAARSSEWIDRPTADAMGLGTIPLSALGLVGVGAIVALAESRKKDASSPEKWRTLPGLAPALVAWVYVHGIYNIGLAVITVPTLAAYLWINGMKSWRMLIGITIGVTITIYSFFILAMGVPFPRARWF